MKVVFLTIVLDGMPWVTEHYPVFRKLPFEWEWHVCEGVASNVKDTSWCKPLPGRYSTDGTTQYIDSLRFDNRVHVYRKKLWKGKIEMVNKPLSRLTDPCLLWQVDSDEIWTGDQISRVRHMFMSHPHVTRAQFFCRYFVGPRLVTNTKGAYGNYNYDWLRVWRFFPGFRFETHEPPDLRDSLGNKIGGPLFSQTDTEKEGIVFDHFSYATRATVEFKSKYYGGSGNSVGKFKDAVSHWDALQKTTSWPVKLRDFFPWVKDNAEVIPI